MKFGTIIATMEGLSEDGALGATEEALEAEQTATDVAEGNVEVVEAAKDIGAMDTGIEDAFEAGDRIEEVLEGAEETMQEGGMTENQAKILEVTVESILSSIGMGKKSGMSQPVVMTLESYASASTRGSATVWTMESIMSTAKDIGGKIVAALKAALNTVINFVNGLLKNRSLMERHLKNLAGQVAALPADAKPKEAKFATSAAAFSIAGKADLASVKKILESSSKLIDVSTKMSNALKESAQTMLDPEKTSAALAAALGGLEKNGDGVGYLTNGRSIKYEVKDKIIEASVLEGKTATEIEAPSKDNMSSLLKIGQKLLGRLVEIEKSLSPIKDAVSKIISHVKEFGLTVASKVTTGKTSEDLAKKAAARATARQARGIMSKAGGTYPAAVYASIKALADFVAAGVKNMGGEAPKKADDKKADDKKAAAKK